MSRRGLRLDASGRCGFVVPEPAPACEVLMVIGSAEAAVRDAPPGAGCVDELTGSCIDAHVIDVPAMDAEEDQVPRGQVVRRNGSRCALLCLGGARNLHASLSIDVDR